MGVKNLWTVLNDAGHPINLRDLHGQKVAIDLSCWMIELSNITGPTTYLRNFFWRCYHLLRNQIKPVFVIDGEAPAVKAATMEKRRNAAGRSGAACSNRAQLACVKECQELLDLLGIEYVFSTGEAEALCAALDMHGVVDGCITNDSDAFLYGANTVYRNFTCNKLKQVTDMKMYNATEITEKLGLDREKLIALSLLVGSDYTDGAKHIGPETVLKLLGKDGKLSTDVLNRMREWRTDSRFDDLKEYESLPKPTHCSICSHQGTKVLHKTKGCTKCETKKNCTEGCDNCDCDYHQKINRLNDNKLEMRVRNWALQDPNFPSEQIISEYMQLSNRTALPPTKVLWKQPNFQKLLKYLENNLGFNKADARQRCNEILVSWELAHSQPGKQLKNKTLLRILRIMKRRIVNSVPMLEVLWEDQGLGGTETITLEEYTVVQKQFPLAVDVFEEEEQERKSTGNLKSRLAKSKGCRRIDEIFKSKKKLEFDSQSPKPSTLVSPKASISDSSTASVTDSSKATTSEDCSKEMARAVELDSLLDGSDEKFSEFLGRKSCFSQIKSKPPANPTKSFSIPLRKNTRKRKSPEAVKNSVNIGHSKKPRRPRSLQLSVTDLFKLKESSIDSIPISSPSISTRSSRSCSSDFTDGASTCSDLMSDGEDPSPKKNQSEAVGAGATVKANIVMGETAVLSAALDDSVPRRSPRESVRQKYHRFTPIKMGRRKLKFGDDDKQPKITELLKNGKPRIGGIRI